MSTKSKATKAQVTVPVSKVVQSEEEEEQEEQEEQEVTADTNTNTDVLVKTERVRTAQKYYDEFVIINNAIIAADPAVQDGVKGTLIFISADRHETIKGLIKKFNESEPKTEVSDKLPAFRTINLSAKKYEKELGFVKAYMNTKEYTNVFLPVAGHPLYTQKEGEKPEFSHEISKGWKIDVKLYMSEERYPELHRMLKEQTDEDNKSIKTKRNDWVTRNHGVNKIDGKIVTYIKDDKIDYRVWDEVSATWGISMKKNKASSAAAKPRPKKG